MNNLQSKSTTSTWILSGQLKPDEPIRSMRIERERLVVGRSSSCELSIPCPSVSGNHAELLIEGNELFVTDLQSTNGTFLNGVRVTISCRVRHGDLLQFAQVVFRVRLEQEQQNTQTVHNDVADNAMALIQFDKLISDRAVAPHYQPIVDIASLAIIGFELLGRSRLFGLRSSESMFTAAAVLDMEAELSRILRHEGILKAERLPGNPILFVNTHPIELTEPARLESSLRELREACPRRPIVLEIHEAAVTNVQGMRSLRSALHDLDIGLAYDDFGAGQARLVELVDVPPDYLKFDICLIRDIHLASPDRQRMIRNLVSMVIELGIAPLAEGVESAEEDEVCQQLGFTVAQGFHYGKPNVPQSFL